MTRLAGCREGIWPESEINDAARWLTGRGLAGERDRRRGLLVDGDATGIEIELTVEE